MVYKYNDLSLNSNLFHLNKVYCMLKTTYKKTVTPHTQTVSGNTQKHDMTKKA